MKCHLCEYFEAEDSSNFCASCNSARRQQLIKTSVEEKPTAPMKVSLGEVARVTTKPEVRARSVALTDEWGHKKVVGGHGDVGGEP